MTEIANKPYAAKSRSNYLPIKGVRKEVISHSKIQYTFGDFVLNSSKVLFHKDKQLSVSPKELAVLYLLLESAGEVVTKTQLIQDVWCGGNVSEESLTRCIYVLRRILQEGKNRRFIDTVYGKGYRFSWPVTRLIPTEPKLKTSSCIIAVLPFKLESSLDVLGLQDAIVEEMTGCEHIGLHVLPSSLTINCRSVHSILELLEKVRPDYYLTGYELIVGGNPSLRIELIRTHDHFVRRRECIPIGNNVTPDLLKKMLKDIILRYIPSLSKQFDVDLGIPLKDSAYPALAEVRDAMNVYTPQSLQHALAMTEQYRLQAPNDTSILSQLAECHFSLGQMGITNLNDALDNCALLSEQVLEQVDDHPLALAMRGLVYAMKSQYQQAEDIFKQIITLAPGYPVINYYYAWHLFINGELQTSLYFARQASQRLPLRIDIKALIMWIEYCSGNMTAALEMVSAQGADNHPLLRSMQAVILCDKGQFNLASEVSTGLGQSMPGDGIIYFNMLYVGLFARSNDDGIEQVDIIMEQPSLTVPAAILPLIRYCKGDPAAREWQHKLEREASPCLAIWRHDPRLKTLRA
ncbi:winged helix-turn-helix domain-containing protein [Biostraticola tofi]|uniref:DNA-binding winged helix-turn-helix (WHTH) protein n=1 Tax=Biostraticola tofi TaxID=466109 RepID=A0A4V2W4P2_9GAMM|nr:winged helix-turn-helix domain-containing protein [Biostraticola tofi]TCV96659.1 DNA-binding winged helix-turn-helix (wHTH) protein [Biostraticola tofi]